MKKLLFLFIVLLFCQINMRAQCSVDTISNDIIMLVDNSASINNAEFGSFSNIILSTINRIAADCPLSRRGVVHYGGAFGQSVNIEHQLSSTAVINNINRQYCINATCNDGGDDLNYAMGEIIRMINNNELQLNPENRLSIVVFTDAFSDAFCSSPNCSVTLPTTNVDILKSTYDANVSVIGMSSDARPEYLAITASPGGTYSAVTLNNACNASLDGCELPRQFIPVEFSDNPLTVAAQVAALVSCQANILSTANVDAGQDVMICSDRGESASLMAVPTSGQAPFTYAWSNNLGDGQSVTATPAMTTTFTVTITDDNGCEGTDQVTVDVQTCGPNCADDTIFNDVIFMIDNSRSIDNAEFSSFENIILTSLTGVRTQCPTSRRALVHYGGAFGKEVSIEYPLASVAQITSVNRQFCLNATCNDGGDDLNYAMGELIALINDGSIGRDPQNKLSIVLFTDAFNDNACATNPNCSTSLPTTNVDILKDAYGATVTVIGISNQATPSTLALSASVGGSFMNVSLDNSCASTFDGCTLPRKYIPVEFSTSPQLVSDSLQACIVCRARIQAKVEIDAGPDQTFCENLFETATINLVAMNGQEPITYQWDNNQGTNASITVRPLVATTYHVTATDANDCEAIDSVTITPIQCNDCFAEAGIPLPHKEICLENGRALITTDDNLGVNIPQGYEKVYILTDRDLTIVDYVINNGIFYVNEAGVYRVHTLVAEVNNRNDEDYFDINLIKRGISNLFIIANCIVDHNICADFDFPGRVHVVLPPGDMMCMTFENTINLCTDGIDNDGDGLVDCNDEDCKALVPCLENTLIACNDLYDNDGDGLVDCFDSDCWEFIRCFEREEDCKDGIDNDGDGLIDCEDDSCFGSAECMENSPYTCKDGLDNDRDGLIDCAEESCREFLVCAEWGETACSDGIDNDFDGLVDCADAECRISFPTTCGAIEASAAFCSDGIDNDADGLVDCADPDCGVTTMNLATIAAAITSTSSTCPNNNNGSLSIELNQTGWEYSINGGESFSANTSYDNLVQGDYEVILRRASGCTVSGPTITITGEQCPEICENGIDDDGDGAIDCADSDCGLLEALPAIVTDPVCPQVDNGSIRLFFLSGGNTAGIEYSSDGIIWQNHPIFRNLLGGTYNIQLRTNKGCTATKTFILSTPECPEVCNNGLDDDRDGAIDCADTDCGISLSAGDVSIGTLTCPSKNDGIITIAHDQSGLQYKIDENPLQDAPSFENLTAGSYLLTVINSSGCQDSLRVIVADIDCSEICDNGIDDDGNGLTDCEDPACSAGLTPTIEKVDASCPFNDNGSITVSIDSIVLNFKLNDGPSQTSGVFENLIPGSYTLSITNESGCSSTEIIEIAGVTCIEDCSNGIDDDGNGLVDCEDDACTIGINATATSTSTTCPDNSDGTILVQNQQGSMDYSLNGETFQAEGLFENLNPGNYVLTIRNANGCSSVQSVVVEGESCFEICDNGIDDDRNGLVDCEDGACKLGLDVQLEVTTSTCPDNNNGSITILSAAAGSQFSIDGQNFQAANVYEDLLPGDYTVTVQNEEGCINTMSATIAESSCNEICDNGIDDDGDGLVDCEDNDCQTGLEVTISSTDASCPNNDNGSIAISGGISNSEYSIDGTSYQSTTTFSGLLPGDYIVTTRNNAGCTGTMNVTIGETLCPEICDNGIDDDGNGLVDCEDGACNSGLEIQLEVSEATCPNNDNGRIQIFGGAEGSEFSLNGQNYQTATVYEDLLPGEYSLAVRNSVGCINTMNITILESSCSEICDNGIDDDKDGMVDCEDGDCGNPDSIRFNIIEIACPSQLYNVEVLNLLEGSLIKLDNGEFQPSTVLENLEALSYNVTVTNPQGCERNLHLDIPEKDVCLEICDNGIDDDGNGLTDCEDLFCSGFIHITHNDVQCPEVGSIEVDYMTLPEVGYEFGVEVILDNDRRIITDSSLPYLFFDSVSIGPHVIRIINSSGCEFEEEVTLFGNACNEICNNGIDDDDDGMIDCQDGECSFQPNINVIDASCPSLTNGSIEISNTGEDFTYTLNDGPPQTLNKFENLSPGNYSIVITRSNGCIVTAGVLVQGPACVTEECTFSNFIIAANPPSCQDEDDGIILIVDGIEGYQYSLSGSAFQLSTNFDGLSAGEYLLTIRNNEGCDTTITTILTTDVQCTSMSEGFIAAMQMDIKVFLEGPYNPSKGTMHTQLNDQGYLPGQLPITYFGKSTPPGQPFSEGPWFYEGVEGDQLIDNRDRLQSAYSETVVDWVLVSLRRGLTKGTEVFRGAGLVHSDGTIEMQRLMEFTENGAQYFIVVEHRNHLPIMSAIPVPVVQGGITFDFTNRDSYRSIIGTGQLSNNGVFMMAAGNGEMVLDHSSDTDINVKDLTAWLFNNGENSSYYLEDYDLNGDINIKDRILWEKNNGLFSPLKTK